MELKLKRQSSHPNFTLGTLSVDGIVFCRTIEDTVRILKDNNKDGDFDDSGEGKVYGETAIPAGTYKVTLSMSNRFGKIMPEIHNVPGFTGVRIHTGNGAIDSHGCIIIGMEVNAAGDGVSMSRIAFGKLMAKMEGQNNITLIIE